MFGFRDIPMKRNREMLSQAAGLITSHGTSRNNCIVNDSLCRRRNKRTRKYRCIASTMVKCIEILNVGIRCSKHKSQFWHWSGSKFDVHMPAIRWWWKLLDASRLATARTMISNVSVCHPLDIQKSTQRWRIRQCRIKSRKFVQITKLGAIKHSSRRTTIVSSH